MNGTPYEAVGLIDSKLDTVGVWQKGIHVIATLSDAQFLTGDRRG